MHDLILWHQLQAAICVIDVRAPILCTLVRPMQSTPKSSFR